MGCRRHCVSLLLVAMSMGCSAESDSLSEAAPLGAQDAASDSAMCSEDCGSCEAGYRCVAKGSFSRVSATCLKVCDTTADCAAGETCLLPNGDTESVCVSPTLPRACDASNDYAHCDYLGQRCRDEHTLYSPISRLGAFCGWEAVHCPAGCAEFDIEPTGCL
jgi:hypothetical protein